MLMPALIDRARQAGKHAMVAGIEAANAPSPQLHETLGFGAANLKSDAP